MQYLFIDESGDHNLQAEKIDPSFPYFVLTGVMIRKEEYSKLKVNINSVKKEIFGTEKIVLHALELTRPSYAKQKELRLVSNPNIRKSFYLLMDNLIQKTDFKVFSFVIHKPSYAKNAPTASADPYFLAFGYILKQFISQLEKREKGKIIAEHRNKILDKQFMLAWESTKLTGIKGIKNAILEKHKIYSPVIQEKSWKNAGLELTDLICYRLARAYMGKPKKVGGNELNLRMINNKNLVTSSIPDFENIPGIKKGLPL